MTDRECVGCDGKPAPENNPCAVCGRAALDARSGDVERVARALYKADTLDQNESTKPRLDLYAVDLDKWYDENAAMPLSGPGFVRRYEAMARAALSAMPDRQAGINEGLEMAAKACEADPRFGDYDFGPGLDAAVEIIRAMKVEK